jgi:hypothetical protein
MNMTLRILLISTAVIGVVFGLCYLLAPQITLGLFGMQTDAAGLLAARFFGGAVLGFGVLAWMHREGSRALCSRVVPSFTIVFVLAFILALFAQFTGLLNAFGWVGVAMFLLLAVGYGYFQFQMRS